MEEIKACGGAIGKRNIHRAQGRKSRLLDDATEQFVEASRS